MSYDKVTQILSEYNGVMLDFSYVKVSKLPRMPRNLRPVRILNERLIRI
jgi:hypothetical protein